MSRAAVVETFFELHNEEHIEKQSPETCPVCDILTRETKQLFEDYLTHRVLFLVKDTMDRWNRQGYRIASETSPELLTSSIVGTILDHPVLPKMSDLSLEASDVWRHPLVDQKIKELSK